MSNKNVRDSAIEFEAYLAVLPVACEQVRHEIIRQAGICEELMNSSYLVADTDSEDWKRLESAVHNVCIWR